MAPLTDPGFLHQIYEALENRRVVGYITWKQVPADWLFGNLGGCNQSSIETAMFEHVKQGLKINQVVETREPYCRYYEFHFDFNLTIDGRKVYIETTLDSSRTGPTLNIVSMHDDNS
jgi:hypothetical protein